MHSRVGLAGLFAAFLFVLLVSSVSAETSPGVPYLRLDRSAEENPRALLLKAASFLTDDPRALERLERRLPPALRGPGVEAGGLLLVQFRAGVRPEQRLELLSAHGGRGIDYVPNNTLLAWVPSSAVEALKREEEVSWIGRLEPAFKLSPLLPDPVPPGDGGASPLELFVDLTPGMDPSLARQAVAAAGGQISGEGPDRLRVWLEDAARLPALARLDQVMFIEPAFTPRALMGYSRGICQSGTPGDDSIHDHGIRGEGEIVALMDSGLDEDHCCFDVPGKIIDDSAWGGGQLGPDCAGDHGTHVAGIAVCSPAGGTGLAPEAQVIMQDIGAPPDCDVVYPPSPLSSAWSDAQSRGARIHSNSWGGGGNSYGGEARAIDDFMWKNQEFLIVFAAGNEGPVHGTLGAYGNAKDSVTVGGTRNGNREQKEDMYNYSSRGPAGDDRKMPDLTAPADPVSSADSGTSCSRISYSGTSMAAPAVAGSAALVRQYFRDGYYPSGTPLSQHGFAPSAALIKAILLVSTRNMTGSGVGGSRPNNDQGFGRLTLDDALWFAGDPRTERLAILDDRDAATGFTHVDQIDSYEVTPEHSGPFKAMLVWTDAPGSNIAQKAIVNDLDLEVELEDGSVYTGNRGFSGGWTVDTATSHDRRSTKEAILFEDLPRQTVTVRVIAHIIGNVALHPQDYSLALVSSVRPEGCGEPLPDGVGNTAIHEKVDGELQATWDDRHADHYVVYRGTTPDFLAGHPLPYEDWVHDEDAGRTKIQWTDTGALSDGGTYFYVYESANVCGDEVP